MSKRDTGHIASEELRYRILSRLLRLGGECDLGDLGLLGSPFSIKTMSQHGIVTVKITITGKGRLIHSTSEAKRKRKARRLMQLPQEQKSEAA